MVIMWRLVLLIPLGLSMPMSRSRTIFSGGSPRARSPLSSPASGPSPKSTGWHTPPCGMRWRCSASGGSFSRHTAGELSWHRPSPDAHLPAGPPGNNPAVGSALRIDPAEPIDHAICRRDLRHSRQAQAPDRPVPPRRQTADSADEVISWTATATFRMERPQRARRQGRPTYRAARPAWQGK